MKFVTKIFNLILLAFTFCAVTLAEWGVYNLTALPSGITNTIGIVSRDTGEGNGFLDDNESFSVKDDNIAYLDTFTFFGTDISESVTREPRYMIRSWFSWEWWQNGMAWADKTAEVVIGAVVPLLAPTYEASQIKTYFSEYRSEHPITVTFYNTENQAVGDLSVVGVSDKLLPDHSNYLYFHEEFNDKNGNGHRDLGEEVIISSIYRVIKTDSFDILEDKPLISWRPQTGEWNNVIKISEIKKAYNSLLKINKYNSGAYDKWANKFLARDNHGGLVVRQAVSGLYFQFYLAIVFSLWFVYQNPIVFSSGEDGSHVLGGGVHWHHKHRDRRERRKEKRRHR